MDSLPRRCAVVLAVALLGAAVPARAQQAQPPPPGGHTSRQVLSANPFGLLLGLFNAEYERRISDTVTAGLGGSTFNSDDDDDYGNGDVFVRYYPSGHALDGLAVGVKAGLTNIDGSGTFFGFGFDTNWSWLLGRNDNFYVGLGFGLKRLFGTGDSRSSLDFVPTVRLVNIGIAF